MHQVLLYQNKHDVPLSGYSWIIIDAPSKDRLQLFLKQIENASPHTVVAVVQGSVSNSEWYAFAEQVTNSKLHTQDAIIFSQTFLPAKNNNNLTKRGEKIMFLSKNMIDFSKTGWFHGNTIPDCTNVIDTTRLISAHITEKDFTKTGKISYDFIFLTASLSNGGKGLVASSGYFGKRLFTFLKQTSMSIDVWVKNEIQEQEIKKFLETK